MSRLTPEGKIRQNYKGDVLRRFMSNKDLADFNETYANHLYLNSGRSYIPSKEDIALWKQWAKKQVTLKECAKAMGVSRGAALSRFAIIATEIALGKEE